MACVSASVLLISSEYISEPAMLVKGVSGPRACARPIAMAVLPVPGWPANNTARPAIFPVTYKDRMISVRKKTRVTFGTLIFILWITGKILIL